MKKIGVLLLFTLLINLVYSQDMTVKQRLALIPKTTNYPYWGTKIYTSKDNCGKAVGLNPEDWGALPIYTWNDLQCTKYEFYDKEYAAFYRKFVPVNNAYCVTAVTIGESDWSKELLITYTNEGKVIDYLECRNDYTGSKTIVFKQWKIESDMRVTIYQLKPTSSETILFDSPFTSVNAQRIDTEYQIDSTGHFIKKSEKKHQPKNYSRTYLEDEKINIWNGNETLS